MSKKKRLTLVPIGGLANRIYTICAAISYCHTYNIELKIFWFKDKGMGATFSSLFEFVNQDNQIQLIDANWQHYIYDRPRKKTLWIPYLFQKLIFNRRFYEKDIYAGSILKDLTEACMQEKNIYLVHCHPFYPPKHFLYFIPKPEIQKMINERASFSPKNTIGIHIRRTDNIISIQQSPLKLFIKKIEEEIKNNPDIQFYLASDSLEEKEKLKNLFGNRIITMDQPARRNTTEGIKEVIVELYTLSRTQKIYGSMNSSFSSLASDLTHIPREILSLNTK